MSWATIFDVVMKEYGVGLRELDSFWTPGRTLLYLRKIVERNQRHKKGRRDREVAMTERDLMKSDFMKG